MLLTSQVRKKEHRTEKLLKEMMTENSPNVVKCINHKIQESWVKSKKYKPKEIHIKYIRIKLLKTEDKEFSI